MQAQQPTEEQVAHDPRLERVIGAILSGAGKQLHEHFPFFILLLPYSTTPTTPPGERGQGRRGDSLLAFSVRV